jgi:hypothetical protein
MPYLAAQYTSPSSTPQTFSLDLPTLSTPPSTQDRVAYLANLQSSLKTLQAEVNAFLTHKMAQEIAVDSKDEETYGEEVVDQD